MGSEKETVGEGGKGLSLGWIIELNVSLGAATHAHVRAATALTALPDNAPAKSGVIPYIAIAIPEPIIIPVLTSVIPTSTSYTFILLPNTAFKK